MSPIVQLALLPSLAMATEPPDVIEKLRTGQRASADAAVVVGIESYPFLPHVPFAARDADAFYNFLVYTRGVSPTKLSLLTDNPTATDIRDALALRAKEVGAGGTLWLYFAGHGAADPMTGKRLLLGVDVQPKVTSLGTTQTVAVDELGAIAAGSAAEQVVAVIDACYTGTGRDGKVLLEGKRFAVPTWTQAPPPKVVTWTAAAAAETSGPFDAAQHGLFTYFVVGALRGWADGEFDGQRDGTVSLAEARQYVYDAVRTVGGGEQTPGLEAAEDRLEGALVQGTALEAAPDLAELVRTDRVPDAPKPAPSTVVTTGGGSDFAARLAELKRLRLEREEAELREAALAEELAGERARQVGAATATILAEAQAAWASTVELLDAGGDEAVLAAELFVETYGSARVVVDDVPETVKVPEVETARSWLLQHGGSAPAPTPTAMLATESAPVVGPDPLETLGSVEQHPLWQLPWTSEKLAKKLGGKIRRDSWDDERWGDAGDAAVERGDFELATYFYLHAVAIDATDSEWNAKLASLGVDGAGLMAMADRVRLDTTNDEAWGDLGDVLVEAGRQAEACGAFQRANGLDATDEEWTRKIGENGCGAVSGHRGDALVEAEAAALLEPDNDERVGDLGDALMAVGQTARACETYQRALDLDPTDSEWPGKLLSCLETTLVVGSGAATPSTADADAVLARIERAAGDDPTVRAVLQAIAGDATEDEHWGDLGDALTARDRELAALAYERAMLLDPVDREWQTRLGEVAGYDRLFVLFQDALRADPSNDEILGDFGDRLTEAGRRDDACQAYRSAARFDPSDSEWPQRVAECDGGGGGPVAAVAGLVDADGLDVLADQVRSEPGNDERWGDYADGLAERGRTSEACEAYQKANELDPVDNEWINAIGRWSCAGGVAAVATEGEDRDDEAVGDRGDELALQGDWYNACEAYREALELDPEDSEWPGKLLGCLVAYDPTGDEAIGDLGDRLASWGRMSEACAAYREALRIDRDDNEWKDRRNDCRGIE